MSSRRDSEAGGDDEKEDERILRRKRLPQRADGVDPPALRWACAEGLMHKRILGLLLLVISVGLVSCQAAIHAF